MSLGVRIEVGMPVLVSKVSERSKSDTYHELRHVAHMKCLHWLYITHNPLRFLFVDFVTLESHYSSLSFFASSSSTFQLSISFIQFFLSFFLSFSLDFASVFRFLCGINQSIHSLSVYSIESIDQLINIQLILSC